MISFEKLFESGSEFGVKEEKDGDKCSTHVTHRSSLSVYSLEGTLNDDKMYPVLEDPE